MYVRKCKYHFQYNTTELPLARKARKSNIIVCKELAQGPYTVTVSDEARICTLRVTVRAL